MANTPVSVALGKISTLSSTASQLESFVTVLGNGSAYTMEAVDAMLGHMADIIARLADELDIRLHGDKLDDEDEYPHLSNMDAIQDRAHHILQANRRLQPFVIVLQALATNENVSVLVDAVTLQFGWLKMRLGK
jgi:hypothetical protein